MAPRRSGTVRLAAVLVVGAAVAVAAVVPPAAEPIRCATVTAESAGATSSDPGAAVPTDAGFVGTSATEPPPVAGVSTPDEPAASSGEPGAATRVDLTDDAALPVPAERPDPGGLSDPRDLLDPGEPAEPADPATPDAVQPGTSSEPDQDAVAESRAAVSSAVRSVDELTAASTSTVGVAVLDRDTGHESVGAAGSRQFYAASLAKLYTVVSILHQVDMGELALSDNDFDAIERALTSSDDDAMNALWVRFGGATTITDTIGLAGLRDSVPPRRTSQWGETLVSARDVVAVYAYVLADLSPESRDRVVGALRAATDEGADGFDQAFGLLAAPRAPDVAAKQGWMWFGARLYLHTAGLSGSGERFVVVVLADNPAAPGAAAARDLSDRAVATALETLPDT